MFARRSLVAGRCLAAGLLLAAACCPAAQPAGGPQDERVRKIVMAQALELKVPVSLALAVAHAESYFDPRAESHVGARGVMQIMPATAVGEYAIHPDSLWDPRLNVRLGLHFLKRLIDRYRGHVDFALSYYNGGSAVGTWPNARIIPATAGYVRKVRGLQDRYRARLLRGTLR